MNKTNTRLQELFGRYTMQQVTESEKIELWDYINDPLFEPEIKTLIDVDLAREHEEVGLTDIQQSFVLENIFRKDEVKLPIRRILWPKTAVAAAVIAVALFGIWFINYPDVVPIFGPDKAQLVRNDIGPGRNGATLTLSTGQVIELSGAKAGVQIGGDLRYDDQTVVSPDVDLSGYSKKGGMLIASTARGQTYTVSLPDGTKVWLNASSSLTFPASFNGLDKRMVQLKGEAYFMVRHNERQPFLVSSAGQLVEDIGTEFNINAYSDEEDVKTTLVEGSAKVTGLPKYGAENRAAILIPNQQAIWSGTDLQVNTVDPNGAIAWKNDRFSFNSEEMASVMRKVSRWYNVEVVFQDDLQQVKVTGEVPRFAKLSALLSKLEKTGLLRFSIEGNKILVRK